MSRPRLSCGLWPRLVPCVCILMAILVGALGFRGLISHLANRAKAEGMLRVVDRPPDGFGGFAASLVSARWPAMAYEAFITVQMEYARDSSESNDVLFMGDSTCFFAINPVPFEKQTGLRAYNLGAFGAVGFDGYDLVLRTYLEHHPRPRLIVLCLQPLYLGGDPFENNKVIRERFFAVYGSERGLAGSLDLRPGSVSRDFALAMRALTGYGVEYDEPLQFHAQMPKAAAHVSFKELKTMAVNGRGYLKADRPWPPNQRSPVRDPQDPFPIGANMAEDFAGFARLAGQHGIPILIRMTPVITGTAAYDHSGLDEWLRQREAETSTKVLVSWPSLIEYDSSNFVFDGLHCHWTGAEKFTPVVAAEVARFLGATASEPRAPGEIESGRTRGDSGRTGTDPAMAVD